MKIRACMSDPGSWTRREETAGGSSPSELAASLVCSRTRPMTIRGVRLRAHIFTALLSTCTRASKQAWVTAHLTVPACTHTPMYTRLRPASLHRLPRTHTHTHTKLPRLTPTRMYTMPVPHGEKGGDCIPRPVGEHTGSVTQRDPRARLAFRRTTASCRQAACQEHSAHRLPRGLAR